MPNFASLSCFYSKLRWGGGAFLPPPSKIGCPNTPSKIGLSKLTGNTTYIYLFALDSTNSIEMKELDVIAKPKN